MNKEKPNIIFMGTPEFAVPTLEILHDKFTVKAVVTACDKPAGRGKKIQFSEVKIKALELGIPVLQPEKLKDGEFINQLKEFSPDIIVVLAFRILPEEVFSIANIATFNIHASLLPQYRGAAPINRAIMNGERITGITSFILEKIVDTGNILLQKTINITDGMTAGELHDIMMPLSAELSVDTCNLLLDGNYKLIKQDDSNASPAPKIFPEDCRINWNDNARNIRNFIHGLSPYPSAWTIWDGKRIKILRAEFINSKSMSIGEFQIEKNTMAVQCKDACISILELQFPGKKPMKITDFIRGFRGNMQGRFL